MGSRYVPACRGRQSGVPSAFSEQVYNPALRFVRSLRNYPRPDLKGAVWYKWLLGVNLHLVLLI